MSNRTANATKKSTRKPRTTKATPKPAVKVRPVEALVIPEKTQKSVRVHLDRNKLPKGNGGVQFKEIAAKDGSTVLAQVYLDQSIYALLGAPEYLTIDVKAGSKSGS